MIIDTSLHASIDHYITFPCMIVDFIYGLFSEKSRASRKRGSDCGNLLWLLSSRTRERGESEEWEVKVERIDKRNLSE